MEGRDGYRVGLLLRQQFRNQDIRRLLKEIHNAASCLAASRDAICKRAGINVERWRVLAAVAHSPMYLSISCVAQRLRLSRQSVHRLTVELERAGWVRLVPSTGDRRQLLLELTVSGRNALAAVETQFTHWLLVLTNGLDDRELYAMIGTVRSLSERLARAREYA
jgi:DNA-binding MarR family transcriptional regulator